MNPLVLLIVLLPGMGFVLSMGCATEENLEAAWVTSHVSWIVLLSGLCIYGFAWFMRRMKHTWTVTAMIFVFMVPCGTLSGNLLFGPKIIEHRDAELMSMLGLLGATCGAIFLYAGELSAIVRKELRARRRKLLDRLV